MPLKCWEYLIISNPDTKTLDQLGRVGWDLVTVLAETRSGDARAYLKRELVPAPPKEESK